MKSIGRDGRSYLGRTFEDVAADVRAEGRKLLEAGPE